MKTEKEFFTRLSFVFRLNYINLVYLLNLKSDIIKNWLLTYLSYFPQGNVSKHKNKHQNTDKILECKKPEYTLIWFNVQNCQSIS